MSETPFILLVDDEEDFREIFKTKLLEAKFLVEIAKSGEEGNKKAKELKPDLILMDVKMPGMDGVEAAMKLKEDPETKNLKVVFLTNLGSIEEEAQQINKYYSQEIGAAGYVRKTDDLDIVVNKVRKFFESKQ